MGKTLQTGRWGNKREFSFPCPLRPQNLLPPRVLFRFPGFHELEGGGVHAVALTRGARTVVEDVT